MTDHEGWRTGVGGTPVAVDVSRDRPTRTTWVVLLGGPVTWIAHFMVVYLVAEAGCNTDGEGLRAFKPPVPAAVTLVATAVAALSCLWLAAWAYRRLVEAREGVAADNPGVVAGGHEEHERGGTLALVSLLLALFSFVAVLFVGAPALVFDC